MLESGFKTAEDRKKAFDYVREVSNFFPMLITTSHAVASVFDI